MLDIIYPHLMGKRPPLTDKRTLTMDDIIPGTTLSEIPDEYDVEMALSGAIFPGRAWRNSGFRAVKNCVIVAKANLTRGFERFEQGAIPTINDEDVVYDYFKQSGGLDTGLYALDSLKYWRNHGWTVNRQGKCKMFSKDKGQWLDIYAFGAIKIRDTETLMKVIYFLNGGYIGIDVTQYAMDQFAAHEEWRVSSKRTWSVGRHMIEVPKYNKHTGVLECWTWGRRQPMEPDFFEANNDEGYGVVDNDDRWIKNSRVDKEKLDAILRKITGGGGVYVARP